MRKVLTKMDENRKQDSYEVMVTQNIIYHIIEFNVLSEIETIFLKKC